MFRSVLSHQLFQSLFVYPRKNKTACVFCGLFLFQHDTTHSKHLRLKPLPRATPPKPYSLNGQICHQRAGLSLPVPGRTYPRLDVYQPEYHGRYPQQKQSCPGVLSPLSWNSVRQGLRQYCYPPPHIPGGAILHRLCCQYTLTVFCEQPQAQLKPLSVPLRIHYWVLSFLFFPFFLLFNF